MHLITNRQPARIMRKFLLILLTALIACCIKTDLMPLDLSYPQNSVSLPADLAAHEWAQLEWWYYTGHLKTKQGESFGFELTFFRRRLDNDRIHGVPLKILERTAYMGNFALVSEKTGQYWGQGNFAPGYGNAHASVERYDVQIQDWKASGDEQLHNIEAKSGNYALQLQLEPMKPAALHGQGGIVPKGPNTANYYISVMSL